AGSNHRPSPHHRDRSRIVPLSQNPGGAPEKESIVGTDGVASTSQVQRKGLKRRVLRNPLENRKEGCEDALQPRSVMAYIEGEQRGQHTLFPTTLDELISEDHVCRV